MKKHIVEDIHTLQQAIKGHEEAVLYQMDSTYIRNENGYIKWNHDENS